MNNTYTTVNTKISLPVNYTVSSGSTTGQLSTTIGSNGTTWATNTSGYQISPSVIVQNDPASLEVKGKIIHNGRDLEERLSIIEKVLNIPERDVKLESKYPKLKKMYEEYIKELSKARMWESLKGTENEN